MYGLCTYNRQKMATWRRGKCPGKISLHKRRFGYIMRYFWSSSTVEEPLAILHTVIRGMVFHFTVHCTYNLLWCTVVHCCIVHCVVAIHRLGWSGDIWLHQRAAVDQYFASAWKQKTKHVAKKQLRSCWRSCVHIPLDHRTIRIMQIQKRHVSRGPQPIQNPVLERPETSLGFPVSQKSRHFSQKVPQRLWKRSSIGGGVLKICFFSLVIKGPCLLYGGGVVLSSDVFSICITQGL